MRLIPVDGHQGLARNKATGAIININSSEMEQARKRKSISRDRQKELKELKSDVSEMKLMLKKLIEVENGNNNTTN